jgi:hypothetical protein
MGYKIECDRCGAQDGVPGLDAMPIGWSLVQVRVERKTSGSSLFHRLCPGCADKLDKFLTLEVVVPWGEAPLGDAHA